MEAKFFVGDYMDLDKQVNGFLKDAGDIRIKKVQLVSTNRLTALEEAELAVMIFYKKKEDKDKE